MYLNVVKWPEDDQIFVETCCSVIWWSNSSIHKQMCWWYSVLLCNAVYEGTQYLPYQWPRCWKCIL